MRSGLRPRAVAALRAFWGARQGVSAVEFALVAPVFCLLMVAAIDFGAAGFTRFNITSAVSSATAAALVRSDDVTAAAGAGLASSLANLMTTQDAAFRPTSVEVVVNNGPKAVVTNGGSPALSGTAANADSCYCPQKSGTTITWGSAQTCGNSCTGGGKAGKFVQIVARRTYTPLFPVAADLFMPGGALRVDAIVQVQ